MHLITSEQETLIAIDILVETYADAPNIKWMFNQNHSNLTYFFRVLIEDAITRKGAYLSSNNNGVLFFYDLQTKNFSFKSFYLKMHLAFFIIGIKKTAQIIRLNNLKKKYRPQNGYYGSILAVKSNDLQWETNFELKKEFSKVFKQFNQPAYLETTNRRIYLLYKKLGFSEYYKTDHPYADLTIYFMKMSTLQIQPN